MIIPTVDELAAREAALGDLPFIDRLRNQRAPDLNGAVARLREQTRDAMTRILGGGGKAYSSREPRDEQRARADKVAQEFELERALTFDRRA